MIAKGGKSVYGADVGILMLQAQFPRIVGDMGNALTWDFPVRYKVVRGATPDLVVRQGAPGLLDAFVEAGRELVEDGVEMITTNCGFLSIFQDELAAALKVPVAASALMQAQQIQNDLPSGKQLGIITISRSSLTDRHLKAANVPAGIPIVGVEDGCELQRVILNDELTLNVELARVNMVDAARKLQSENTDLGAILFECTNMPPYADMVRIETGLPVFSIKSYVEGFWAELRQN